MHIHRLEITNYRGIAALEQDIPDSGAIVSGGNARGKTSVLRAVQAALAARDIGADAIRIGTDRAEILVNLDDVSVRRVITANGTRLDVTRGGMSPKKPQTFLNELLGTSPLDPLDLVLAPAKERRARVMAALPITVTLEQLRAWAPDADVDTAGHGLDVLERAREAYYDRRAAANKAAKDAAEVARAKSARARDLAGNRGKGPSVAAASAALDEAQAALAGLRGRDAEARGASDRARKGLERAETLGRVAAERRKEAASMRVSPERRESASRDLATFTAQVAECERALADARMRLAGATRIHESIAATEAQADDLDAQAESREQQARDLRATLDEVAAASVDPAALDAAQTAVSKAIEGLELANLAAAAALADADAERAEAAQTDADAEAARLDAIVKALSNDAPAALLASANGIPGLGFDGDDVTLDGKRLGALSGAEQIRLCVDVAKRLGGQTKLLVVDGLERLDEEQRETFVRFATADGWQLLGTLVTRGDAVFGAIEPSEAAA